MDAASMRLLDLFEGHRLTPTQRRIAHCLVRTAAEAPFLSSVELAALAGVSQPSVTRFAVALGYDGYPALRRALREALRQESAPHPAAGDGTQTGPAAAESGPDGTGGPAGRYQQALWAEIERLRRLAALAADPGPITEAGRRLAASRPLPVLGLRAAAAQARGFAFFAAKVHPDVRVLDEGGTMLADRLDGAVAAGATAVLCFALPRYPVELAHGLARAREAGLGVVTVADGAFPPIAERGDLVLPAEVGRSLTFDTACAPMMLGRLLLEALCDALPGAQARLEEFDGRAAARGLFLD